VLCSTDQTYIFGGILFTVLQITPVCFQNESETTVNICNSSNEPRNFIIRKVTYLICSKIRRLRSKYYTDKVQHELLPPQPEDCFKRREPGVSMVRIVTECKPLGAHQVSLNECELVLIPWFAPGVHSDWCEPWKASEYHDLDD